MAEVLAPEHQGYFAQKPVRRSQSSSNFLVGSPQSFASELHAKLHPPQHNETAPSSHSSSFSSSAPASTHSSHVDLRRTASTSSTPSTNLSLESSDSDGEIDFPKYCGDDSASEQSEDLDQSSSLPCASDDAASASSRQTTPTPDRSILSVDDTALREEPVRQVDYLSHEWREQDIWSSWRYIVSQRRYYGERSRLENASWRTWAKQKNHLKTVSPETLNWLKDCDVTWLYGPLQTSRENPSEPVSNISKSNSFLRKKPILKKRSMSEVMLQKSLSTSSLVKQAAAAVKAQEYVHGGARTRGRPILNGRAASDFVTPVTASKPQSRDTVEWLSSKSTSGLQTPADGEKRHIRFDEKVEQCIALDAKEEEDEEELESHKSSAVRSDDESSSDDGVIMMKADRKRSISRSNSRSSFSGESKTIAMLPSTTLKYRTDSPDITNPPSHSINTHFWKTPKLSPSPSQETLRPANPSTNFLLSDEDSSEDDISWEPSGAFSNRIDSLEQLDRQYSKAEPRDIAREYSEPAGGLRRTESGMFMPFEDEEEAAVNNGLFGRVLDGVNTAKDIAHVIWNVGWKGNQ